MFKAVTKKYQGTQGFYKENLCLASTSDEVLCLYCQGLQLLVLYVKSDGVRWNYGSSSIVDDDTGFNGQRSSSPMYVAGYVVDSVNRPHPNDYVHLNVKESHKSMGSDCGFGSVQTEGLQQVDENATPNKDEKLRYMSRRGSCDKLVSLMLRIYFVLSGEREI
ncbi:hypothetical protein Tco_0213518 [Tanacetum coccineum]